MCHAGMALGNVIPAPWKVPLSPSLDLGLCAISPEYFLDSRVSPNPQQRSVAPQRGLCIVARVS